MLHAEIAASRVGTTLREKWHLDRLLGVGGMAAVYAATHRNGTIAAVKVLHPECSAKSRLAGNEAVASPPSGTSRASNEQIPFSNTSQAISPASGFAEA